MLESEERDVVFRCTNCGQGYAIVEGELKGVKISFASPRLQEPGQEVEYHPFWVLRSDVDIKDRSARGGFFRSAFGEGKTSGEVIFYIPGFNAPLKTLKELGMSFTKSRFNYETSEARGRALKGCIHSENFARGFADFIFLSIEAEKADKMRSIGYSIEFKEPEVLAVPFVSTDKGKKKDLLTGLEVKGW